MKKKIVSKKVLPKTDYNTVLLEDLTSKFRAFGEGLDSVNQNIGDMKADISILKADVSEIKMDLKSLDARLSAVEEKLETISIDMTETRKEIRDIRRALKNKADADDYDLLKERVVRLEKRFAHI